MWLSSCIEDGVSTSPSDQPEFSADTLKFGEQFSGETTTTHMLMVYNRHSKVMSISNISLRDGGSVFRLNVDGQSGKSFSGIEIRPNDSIYVLVSATLPVNGTYDGVERKDAIQFTTNGVTRTVVLTADSYDIERLENVTITDDTRWDGDHPRRIYGTLRVGQGATLTLGEGCTLYFHDKAQMIVDGRLVSEGSAQRPVVMRGDRLGSVVGDISFDLMASQWQGVTFTPTSSGHELKFTEIRNTVDGVQADTTDIQMLNCRLRNSAGDAFAARHSQVKAVGCEFAEAAYSALALTGGSARIANCTISNYYLFAGIGAPLVRLAHTSADDSDGSSNPYMQAAFVNSILYGMASEMNLKTLDGLRVTVNHCMLRSNGSDDDNFIDCLWGVDPMWLTERSEYLFDYRLKAESPALGASNASTASELPATDFYGTPRLAPASLGAYEQAPN